MFAFFFIKLTYKYHMTNKNTQFTTIYVSILAHSQNNERKNIELKIFRQYLTSAKCLNIKTSKGSFGLF